MVTVASLLNPLPPSCELYRDTTPPCSDSQSQASPKPGNLLKKQKIQKPNVTCMKGETKGKVNYKPCEAQDKIIKAEHEKFEVEPIGRISQYPKHIPYNSEKKSFQQRTGRDAFEAYRYTFRMPNDDREKEAHAVMWDYNVGLVRITSLFKSLKHSKTMPAKVMNANPGLREISHSITGGSISAQGYWVPFEAAKAVAATFCYEIRYVLTPVFGLEFPDMCTEPDDPAFLRTSIDQRIIQCCTEAAKATHACSQAASLVISPNTSYHRPTLLPQCLSKSLRPKPRKIVDQESGYGTDTDRSCSSSPQSGSGGWTPVNIPRSTMAEHDQWPTSAPTTANASPVRPLCKSGSKGNGKTKRALPKKYEASEGASSSEYCPTSLPAAPKRRKMSSTLNQDARAAYTLMQLHMADATLAERKGPKLRRASG